jgi:hypothetical protein
MKVIGAITSVPRNMQTRFNPLFPVRLLTYDLPWQYIVNPDSKGPYSGFLAGLGHMTADPEGYAGVDALGRGRAGLRRPIQERLHQARPAGARRPEPRVQYVERGQDAVRC